MYHCFLIHSSADGHLGCFHALAIINSAAMNIGYTCLFPFWFPQCVCPAVGLLDHKAVLFPVFEGISRAFVLLLTHTNVYILKAWYHFALPVIKLCVFFCNSPFWDISMLMHVYLPVFTLLFKKKHPFGTVGSPWYQTCVPCIGRWILNRWTTREVLRPCIRFSCCIEFQGTDLRCFVLSTAW